MRNITELTAALSPVFKNYNIEKAILFGSYAKKNATDKSDLDLLVSSNLHGLRFVGFMEDIRRAVQIPVDIFDTAHIEKDSMIEREIRSTGVTIYDK